MSKLKRGFAIAFIVCAVLCISCIISSFLYGCAKSGCAAGKHQTKVTITEPTCVAQGSEVTSCVNCGVVLEERIVPATGEHVKDDGTVTKTATCTTKGEMTYKCKICKTDMGKTDIQFAAHTKDAGEVIEQSTCAKHGKTLYHCTECGAECGTEELQLAEHEYVLSDGYWLQSGYVAPTATNCAVIPYGCKVCNQKFATEYNVKDFVFDGSENIHIEDKYNTETAVIYDGERKRLVLNLAGSDLNKTLQKMSEAGYYNASSKILTVPAKYNSAVLSEVKVVGFKTPSEAFAITTEICNEMYLTLQNIVYKAPRNVCGLNLENVNNAIVEIVGMVNITGGVNGMAGISANDLTFAGTNGLTVKGGDGVTVSGSGTAGGIGIKAKNLTLSLPGSVNVIGGNGGVANNRSASDNDGEGSNGKSGYNGGAGGAGVFADRLTVTYGQCNITGGNGGRGGDGSECNRSEFVNTGSKNVVGGDGGNGGNGGVAVQVNSVKITAGTINAVGGNGGDSGKAGGCHADDHSGFVALWGDTTAQDGSRGYAGNGGAGLSNCTVEGNETLITKTAGNDGTVNTDLNQDG